MLSPSCLQVADFKTARSQGGSCTDSPFGWKWTYTLVQKQRNDQAEIHIHLVEKIKFIWHFWIIQIRNLFQLYYVHCSHVPWEIKFFPSGFYTFVTVYKKCSVHFCTVHCAVQSAVCTLVYLCRGRLFSACDGWGATIWQGEQWEINDAAWWECSEWYFLCPEWYFVQIIICLD